MPSKKIRRGRSIKAARRDEALDRAEKYKKPEVYTGLRERIKHGVISVDGALLVVESTKSGIWSTEFVEWLERKKREKFKVKSVKETKPGKKRGTQKNKDVASKNIS